MQSERLLTVQDVARRLAITPETVRRWLRAGRLKGFSLGSDKAGWRIRERDLVELLATLEGSSPQPDHKDGG